jgi:DNA-binding HxlR family transcriptional regulator
MNKIMNAEQKLNCPVTQTLNIVGGKWKALILFQLTQGHMRTGELERNLPGITQKMLIQQLRELEQDGLVLRKVYAEVPPRVEYSLTELGLSFLPVLKAMADWGHAYRQRTLTPEREAI